MNSSAKIKKYYLYPQTWIERAQEGFAISGVGKHRPDATEGFTCFANLPQAKVVRRC